MIRQFLFAVLFTIAGISLPGAAHADAAGETLVRDALNAIALESGWTASADIVRSEGGEVIVEGLSIANSGAHFRFTAGRIALAGLTGRGDGYFATGVSLHDIAVDYEPSSMAVAGSTDKTGFSIGNRVRMEAMTIADLYLPAGLGVGTSDAGGLTGYIAFYNFLAKVELVSLDAPTIRLEQTFSMPKSNQAQESRGTYSLRAMNWADGVVARYELGSMDLDVTGGAIGDYSVKIESTIAEHLDLAHVAHVFDPAEYAGGVGDGIWKQVLGRADYSGIRVSTVDINADLARLSLSGLSMRQSDKPFAAYFESLMASGLAGKDPGEEPDEEEVVRMMRDVFPGIFGSFRVGEFRLEDMQVRPVVSSKPGRFAMKEFRLAGLSSDGIDQVLLSGLSGAGPGVDIRLGTFRFDGIGFPKWESFAAIIELAAEIEKNPKDPEVGSAMARRVMEIYPTADHFLMQGLSANAPGKDPFKVDEVEVEVTKRAKGFKVGGTGAIRGVMVPASYFDEGDGPNPLTLLDYDRFAMDLDFESAWNEATTDIDYTLNMQVEDVGDLSLGYRFSGFTEQGIEELFEGAFALGAAGGEDVDKIVALFSDIGFRGFVLAFTDRSIVDRALTLASAQQGSDAQTYRSQLKAALPFFLSAMPPGDFRQQVIDAAQAALDGGRKTTFSLTPAEVVMIPDIVIASMQDPLSLIGLLGAGMASQPAE